MRRTSPGSVAVGCWLVLILTSCWVRAQDDRSLESSRKAAAEAFAGDRFSEALGLYRQLCLDPKNDSARVAEDLENAVRCFARLHNNESFDELVESTVKAHPRNWQLLRAAASSYLHIDHQGALVNGQFVRRISAKSGERNVLSHARDRARGLQLLERARVLALAAVERDASLNAAVAELHASYAFSLGFSTSGSESWRLQLLTNLEELPEYEDFGDYRWFRPELNLAPVDADNRPVYHVLPASWEQSASDGERIRWLLREAMRLDPERRTERQLYFAQFCEHQFGTNTLARSSFWPTSKAVDRPSGTYALHTLSEDETIARLATGVQRFKLPDEFNSLKLFRQIAAGPKSIWSQIAQDSLARSISIPHLHRFIRPGCEKPHTSGDAQGALNQKTPIDYPRNSATEWKKCESICKQHL